MNSDQKKCPGCGKFLDIPDEYYGLKVECPYCHCKFLAGLGKILFQSLEPAVSHPVDQTDPEKQNSSDNVSSVEQRKHKTLAKQYSARKRLFRIRILRWGKILHREKKLVISLAFVFTGLMVACVGTIVYWYQREPSKEEIEGEDVFSFGDDQAAVSSSIFQLMRDNEEYRNLNSSVGSTSSKNQKGTRLPSQTKEKDPMSSLVDENGSKASSSPIQAGDQSKSSPKPSQVKTTSKEAGSTAQSASSGNEYLLKEAKLLTVGEQKFKKIAEISGIDVIVRADPFKMPMKDRSLNQLFQQGASSYKRDVERCIAEHLNVYSSPSQLARQISVPEERLALARYELLRVTGTDVYDQIRKRREGENFLLEFLTNADWIEDFLMARYPDGKGDDRALQGLCSIYRYDKQSTIPLYRKLACAYALHLKKNSTNAVFYQNLLDCFQAHKRVHLDGLMDRSFDWMESWEMAYCVCNDGPWASNYMYDYARFYNTPQAQFESLFWTDPHHMKNDFGDSVRYALYYQPWLNEGNNYLIRRQIGAVPNQLPLYETLLARVHGIPALQVGQTWDNAYMLRTTDCDLWTAFHVPRNTKVNCPFGEGDESIFRLMKAAYENRGREHVRRAFCHDWQAHFLCDKGNSRFSSAEKNARKLSLKESPQNIVFWRDCLKRMRETHSVPIKEWEELAYFFVESVGAWPRPCWEFFSKEFFPEMKKLPKTNYLDFLIALHRRVPKIGFRRMQQSWKEQLTHQMDEFKSTREQERFLISLMSVYDESHLFQDLLSWGQSYFSQKRENLPIYIHALKTYKSERKGNGPDLSSNIASLVLSSEKNNDWKGFEMGTRLAHQLYPKYWDRFYMISAEELKKGPEKKAPLMMGQILSIYAVPILEDPVDSLSIIGHFAALQRDQFGLLKTNFRNDPSITIHLKGKSRLSGFVLVGCFDDSDWEEEQSAYLVESSLDGKEWEKVMTIDPFSSSYAHRFLRERVDAEYVRFSFVEKKEPKQLSFRAIRIYGTPQY